MSFGLVGLVGAVTIEKRKRNETKERHVFTKAHTGSVAVVEYHKKAPRGLRCQL